jgi:hypothetical protein
MAIQSLYPALKPSLALDFANTKVLDSRVTFTRASTATYYDGKTFAKAEENLLTQSQTFTDAIWQKGNTTATGSAGTAPDGTTTATLLAETTANAAHTLGQGLSGGFIAGQVHTMSVYLKKGTGATAPDWVQITADTSYSPLTPYANVNLTTGLVGGSSALTATMTAVGNGWYRCVVTGTPTATTAAGRMFVCFTNNLDQVARAPAYTGATTSDVFVWGAQAENRAAVTAYTPTTTAPITNYIPVLQTAAAKVARFDHNPVTGESLGLLIEEQRVNLLTYSAQFDDAAWTKTFSSVQPNVVVAPDGTLTGDKLIEDATNNARIVGRTFGTSGTTYSHSVYLKAAERSWAVVQYGNAYAWFNLSNGTIGTQVVATTGIFSITSVGNGWYRCTATFTATANNQFARIYSATADNVLTYTGDGFSGIYIWGAQLEAGAFPTSYIPTVASQVTRSVDAATMTGTNFSSWYRQDEGTMFAQGTAALLPATPFTVFDIASSATNRAGMFLNQTGTVFGFSARNNDFVNTLAVTSAVRSTTSYSAAFAFRVNDAALSVGGAAAITDTAGLLADSVTFMNIGARSDTGSRYNGHIRTIRYYPARLTNAQLQAITS